MTVRRSSLSFRERNLRLRDKYGDRPGSAKSKSTAADKRPSTGARPVASAAPTVGGTMTATKRAFNSFKFDITLLLNGASSSKSLCARHVRWALEAALDADLFAGHPDEAWEYAAYLPSIGFSQVADVGNRPGDIVVYYAGPHVGQWGHIAGLTKENGWISDFRQTSRFGWDTVSEPPHAVFRWG